MKIFKKNSQRGGGILSSPDAATRLMHAGRRA